MGRPRKAQIEDIQAPVEKSKASGAVSAMTQEENESFIRLSVIGIDLESVDLSDGYAVTQRVKQYSEACVRVGAKPNPPGLANWLGVNMDEFLVWMNSDKSRDGVPAKVKRFLEASWSDYLLANKVNAAAGIFASKNWFGYADDKEVETVAEDNVKHTAEELKAIADALPEQTEIIVEEAKNVE